MQFSVVRDIQWNTAVSARIFISFSLAPNFRWVFGCKKDSSTASAVFYELRVFAPDGLRERWTGKPLKPLKTIPGRIATQLKVGVNESTAFHQKRQWLHSESWSRSPEAKTS